jgi:CheY-like chemotaxis protein/Tfp pilus assembly protein PilZ
MSNRPNVIVADSNEQFLVYLSTLLGRMNFEVLAILNGAEAFDLARIVNPNLIFLEAEGEEESGIKILDKIRKDNLLMKIPVIMLGHEDSVTEHCFAAGCSDFLTKPVDLTHLHTSLQKCLPNREGMRQYLRATFNQKISFEYAGLEEKGFAVTLSEGGVFLRTSNPLPVGSKVKVKIPLDSGDEIVMSGIVVYAMGLITGRFLIPPGMAVQFNTTDGEETKQLSREVCRLLIDDIVDEQEEPIFKCDRGL